jgi:Uma2 family endonuclease
VAVIPGAIRDYTKAHPTTALFVVEIADFSLALDTGRKADLYAAAGVPDYWVIDLEARELLVFRDPLPSFAGGASYRTRITFCPADAVAPLAAPAAAVRVADLLP